MPTDILATKLFKPFPRPNQVNRSHLLTQLNRGLSGKLTLVSAPAGFGKTALLGAWVGQVARPTAWLSLDEGDSDPTRFLTYTITALQTIAPAVGGSVLPLLQAPQPPDPLALLTPLLNDLAALTEPLLLVFDDYHLIDSAVIDNLLTFLLTYLPPQLHLAIATREDPQVPLARLRARGALSELRVGDLRFSIEETTQFFHEAMGLSLAAEHVDALEQRTEGWIAGLQLAALSLQRQDDVGRFIASFTGSHHFVLDYLLEEVLHQQLEHIQTFLLKTSVLNRLCGALCDRLIGSESAAGQTTLEQIENANLFVIPLDNERRWYRYHHLFADLLRQRLAQSTIDASALHQQASAWYEQNELPIDAFQHAVAADDVANAARLVEGDGMPLLFRGAVAPVLGWFESLSAEQLDAHPGLWVLYASAKLFVGQHADVPPLIASAELALAQREQTTEIRDWIGHVASIRATMAVAMQQPDAILAQSQRALDHLHPHNIPVRTATSWTLAVAYQLMGERAAARTAFEQAIAGATSIGHFIIELTAATGLGSILLSELALDAALASFQQAQATVPASSPLLCEAMLGVARSHYARNQLDKSEAAVRHSLLLSEQVTSLDTAAFCHMLLAQIALARAAWPEAHAALQSADAWLHKYHFESRLPQLAAVRIQRLLLMGDVAAAELLANSCDVPLAQAHVLLAQQRPDAALSVVAALSAEADSKRWPDVQLSVALVRALALAAKSDFVRADAATAAALTLARSGQVMRPFVDTGRPMAQLVQRFVQTNPTDLFAQTLLNAFPAKSAITVQPQPLIEPLSSRELDVLRLVADGYSNRDIASQLFLALNTVKGHNRRIFGKLGVQRRTEAVARARKLGLI